MAKILVADDNSNVQKTVALALADLGIEVIAVNNGEAAVKKLPDVMPDLVLADIFMPVRNGYEVCEYVKKDSRFAQVPVVLLVGAFDPLDEREAQRVGADGILKKPFVPPDPLIAMVKTLLERAIGERIVPVAVAAPVAAKRSRSGGVAVADDHSSGHDMSEEPQELPMMPPPKRMSFEDSEGLVAFSQLLDAPELKASGSRAGVAEVEDNEQILTSKRDESLGAPIFWKSGSSEPTVPSGDSEAGAEADDSAEIPAVSWRLGADPASEHAESAAESKIPEEQLVLVHDEKDQATNQVSTMVEASPLLAQDPASQASLTVEASKAEDLAANPLEWMASVPPPKQEEAAPADVFEWSPAVPEPTEHAEHFEAKEPAPPKPTEELAAAELPAVQVPPVVSIPEVSASAKTEEVFSIPAPPISPIPEAAVLIAAQAPAGSAQSVEDTVPSIPREAWTDLSAKIQSKESAASTEESAKSPAAHAEPKIAESADATPATPSTWPPVPLASKSTAMANEETASSRTKRDWAELVSDLKSQTIEPTLEKRQAASELVAHQNVAVETKSEPVAVAAAETTAKPSTGAAEDTARALPKLDWADLAASIQPRASEAVMENAKAASPANSAVNWPSSTPDGRPTSTISALAAALARSAGAQSHVVVNAPTPSVSEASLQSSTTAASVPEASSQNLAPAATTPPDPALVEAVVQRVLDKMRPQVVDIITKEFLRPVVQALVHREITKR